MKTESGKEKRMVQELDLLKKHQKISVKELAAALGVSEMTVRRDLELLRKNHVLERSYGYATLVEGGNGYSYEGENYDLVPVLIFTRSPASIRTTASCKPSISIWM